MPETKAIHLAQTGDRGLYTVRVTPVQATSVFSERSFSLAGYTSKNTV